MLESFFSQLIGGSTMIFFLLMGLLGVFWGWDHIWGIRESGVVCGKQVCVGKDICRCASGVVLDSTTGTSAFLLTLIFALCRGTEASLERG